MSMSPIWATEFVYCEAQEKGASAGKARLKATGADVGVGMVKGLSRIPIKRKGDGAAGGH